jgi:hypothetical protein
MYQPTPAGHSRRMEKAIEHIETGCNTFEVRMCRWLIDCWETGVAHFARSF